ncbi:MAG: MFS transporter [Chloroflexi bacterium]|nr:MAG: MFS transporter [Chloroflexota bacterium]
MIVYYKIRQQRHLLFYTLCLAYIGTGISGPLPGPALTLLATHTHVGLDTIGWAFTATSLGFTIGVVLVGKLSERIHAKYILMAGLTTLGLATALLPWTESFAMLLILSLCSGIGNSLIDVSINVLAAIAFEERLNETLNYIHSSFGVGACVGPLLLSVSLETSHNTTWAFLAGALLCKRQFSKRENGSRISSTRVRVVPLHTASYETALTRPNEMPQHRIIMHRGLWLMALQMFLYIGGEIGFGNWVTTTISQSAQLALAFAAPATTIYWFGLAIGRLLSAQLLKRDILNDYQLLYLSILGGSLSVLCVAFFPTLLWLSFSASLLTGLFFGPIYPGIMALASRRFVHAVNTVSSVLVFSAGASGLVFPVIIGIMLTHVGVASAMTIPALTILAIVWPLYVTMRK